ncbi:pentapeptide repeat-containing protein [Kamptonema formosum]|uniref:pentapeptide repeat-containing protein n=1 Tax=Kamptonema formosum TaxID=331992 RepID=UPI0003469CCB|nr:pentapeptide repeat-containing protein [Oscillatoria sp. PCC 10802]
MEIPFPESMSWEQGQFKGLDLSGIILRKSSIRWVRIFMDGVILRGADLTDVDLGESNFEGADLSHAILRVTRFFQSVFDRANLSGADLTGAALVESGFFGANLSGANLNNARISSMGFVCTDLTEATFKEARLASVWFEEAKLLRTDFLGAEFSPETFRGSGVRFRDCHFEGTLMPDGSVRSCQVGGSGI